MNESDDRGTRDKHAPEEAPDFSWWESILWSHDIVTHRETQEWFASFSAEERGLLIDMAYDMVLNGELSLTDED